MSSSITSGNNFIKSLIRLQLLKCEIKSNYFNDKKNYSVFLPRNNDENITKNNCKYNKLIINRHNHNNQPEYVKSKVRNQVLIRRRGNFMQTNSEMIEKSSVMDEKSLEKANKSLSVIFESENPSLIIGKPIIELDEPNESDESDEEVDIDDGNDFLTDEVLKKFKVKPSDIDPRSFLKPTFNFAAYANKSETIQELVKLGVELYKLEKYPKCMLSLLRRNFDDIKPYIQFLHDCGVPADKIGQCLTKFPLIIDEDLDDLHTRIRYLRAHKFSIDDIQRIMTVTPRWLSYTTKEIDAKLGYIQVELSLSGSELRYIMVKNPKLIRAKRSQLRVSFFSIKEEMCFDEDQMKKIVMDKPGILTIDRQLVASSFEYVCNDMLVPHETIANMPIILMTPLSKIKDRHEFLKLLKRDQYDPTKPLYVSLNDIARSSDYEFCIRIAGVSIQLYDMFLKTR